MGNYRRSQLDAEDWVAVFMVATFFTALAAFIRHIWWIFTICMSGAPLTGGHVVLAVIGLVFPPIGALHGVWLWCN